MIQYCLSNLQNKLQPPIASLFYFFSKQTRSVTKQEVKSGSARSYSQFWKSLFLAQASSERGSLYLVSQQMLSMYDRKILKTIYCQFFFHIRVRWSNSTSFSPCVCRCISLCLHTSSHSPKPNWGYLKVWITFKWFANWSKVEPRLTCSQVGSTNWQPLSAAWMNVKIAPPSGSKRHLLHLDWKNLRNTPFYWPNPLFSLWEKKRDNIKCF